MTETDRERNRLVDETEDLFAEMERKYRVIAESYGFSCSGCADNCCRTVFHHHTVLERLLLDRGLRSLTQAVRQALKTRAKETAGRQKEIPQEDSSPCPLLLDDACILYRYRPMICRLHGVPHKHLHPARGLVTGHGCHKFLAEHPGMNFTLLDRTALYSRFAALENRARSLDGTITVPGETVAEILLNMLR